MVWLSWTDRITTKAFLKSSMTPPNSGPSRKIPLLREGRLQRLLRKLKKDGHLDSDVYENIYPKGSHPARIYGLPKMHKDRGLNSAQPFRPIVSSIGTYNYNLAKYLCNLLSLHIPTEHCATDTFTFVQDIKSLYQHTP